MENDDLQQELDRVLADFVPRASRTFTAPPTTSYKGVSVPSNSALLRQDTSVLAAYRTLLSEENANSTGAVPSNIDAQLSALPLFITAPNNLSFNVQLLINTLPVLDNLATQILRIITKGPYQKVMELVSNRESSYSGIAFSNLIELFETTKRVYNSEESPFFTVENITFGLWRFGEPSPSFLRGREDTVEGTLRKVNLSTFLLATLGLVDLGFFFLNEAFLDVFCPPQNLDPSESLSNIKQNDAFSITDPASIATTSRIFSQQRASTKFLKAQALLFLELKTQAYISALELGDRSREEIIADLFPETLPELLLRRRDSEWKAKLNELDGGLLSTIVPNGDYKPTPQIVNKVKVTFTPAEYDFLQRCTLRKSSLLRDTKNTVGAAEGETVNLSQLMERYEWIRFLNDLLDYVSRNVGFLIWGPKGKVSQEFEKRRNQLANASKHGGQNGGVLRTVKIEDKGAEHADIEKPAGGEHVANNVSGNIIARPGSNQSTGARSKRTSADADLDASVAEVTEPEPQIDMDQLASMTTPKPSAAKRSKNRPATFRRVWTEEEESALREGLKVKGTQWTSILELFGPGGRINEALKNRTSLQLKDKARNWKLWYIKNQVEVPDWLKAASGSFNKGGSSKPGTPIEGGEGDKSSDRAVLTGPKKGRPSSHTGSKEPSVEPEQQAKAHEEVSEDQYDQMLSLLAKSADGNDVMGANAIVEHLSRSPEQGNDKSESKGVTDGHAEIEAEDGLLKNLVAEAFK